MERLAERLVAASRNLVELGPTVEAGEPWPLSETYGVEPEASWGPKEVLAHVAEMVPYWDAQIQRILAAAESRVPFGRVESNADRIARIEQDRMLPAAMLVERIADGVSAVAAGLRALEPEALERIGLHAKLGELTVGAIVERFLIAHLEDHDRQLRAILGTGEQI